MRAADVTLEAWTRVEPFAPVHRLEGDIQRDQFVVIEDLDGFVGIVTVADLIRRPRRLIVDCLTEKPRVTSDQPLEEVLATMGSSGEPFLPVFDGATFKGVVSYRSVVTQLTRERAALRAQRVMAGGLAHDINNSLMAVHGEIELAQQGHDATETDGALARARAALAHVTLLAQELSSFGLGVEAPAEVVAFHDLVERWARLAARSVHLKLELQTGGDHFTVRGVRLQLAQLVYNLVLNAGQAAGKGGEVNVSVSAITVTRDRFVELVVADNGPGISPDVRRRMFDAYFTTRDDGTGLGLAIVAAVVEAHDGAIEITTPPSGGTRVVVRLPRATA